MHWVILHALLSSAEFFQKGVSLDPGQTPDMSSNCLLMLSSGEHCLIEVELNEYKMLRYKIVPFLHDNALITWVKVQNFQNPELQKIRI